MKKEEYNRDTRQDDQYVTISKFSYKNITDITISQSNEIKDLKSRIDKAIELIEKQMPVCIMPNNMLIHGTEKAKVLEKLLNILKGERE